MKENKLNNVVKKDFENMNIQQILKYGFNTAGTFLLVLGIVSVIGLIILMMEMTNYRSKTVATDLAMKNVRIDINVALKYVREGILLGGDDLNSSKESVESFYNDANEQLDIVNEIGIIDQSATEAFRTEIANWYATANAIMDYSESGDIETAKNLIKQECIPEQQKLIEKFNEILIITDALDQRAIKMVQIVFWTEMVLIITIIIISLSRSAKLANKITNQIVDPIREIEKASKELRIGNLHTQINYESNNEMGVLAKNLQEAFQILNGYVEEISKAMDNFSDGNMDVEFQTEYLGDFQSIGTSMVNFSEKINNALSKIGEAAGNVNGGAEQIACASQDVAEGASDQSASIEELTATVTEMSQKVNETAVHMKEIHQMVVDTSRTVEEGNQKMIDTKAAMQNISEKSEQIKGIIGTMDEITSQTTLLALNASIEAARAGELGRGFAVVANEVNSLAEQSSMAAKDIARLIDETLKAVEYGNGQVDETSEALKEIVLKTTNINKKVEDVSDLTEIESEGMTQLSQAIEQVSSVVDNNSASSQQTAASSLELSTNAQDMLNLLNDFRLKK